MNRPEISRQDVLNTCQLIAKPKGSNLSGPPLMEDGLKTWMEMAHLPGSFETSTGYPRVRILEQISSKGRSVVTCSLPSSIG